MTPIEFWLTVVAVAVPAVIGLFLAIAKFRGWF